jgi:SNF2 family DNA or RNA helicase
LSLLQDTRWKARYDSDERDLVGSFFVPALECATRYDRTTGYFSASVLSLAARGIEGLVRNDGRMRLIVGCTLGAEEVAAIERGEEMRATVEARMRGMPLMPAGAGEESALELLSWMVTRGYLEVRVAIPSTPDGRPCAGEAIFHEKTGIIEDKTGDRLVFSGSLNETAAGWMVNWESFHVFTTWDGGLPHAQAEEESFSRLWADKAKHCRVIDVPQALRDDLLRFLPGEGETPRRLRACPGGPIEPPEPIPPPKPPGASVEEIRRAVWGLVQHGPALAGLGDRVGEATSIVTPWPHQVRAFDRLYGSWPPKLLIADEVGLGKTIEAGLLLRQAWLAGRAKRVLVLAPKAILRQWQVELREKFNLNWPIYDGQALRWYPCHALQDREERKVSKDDWHREPCVLTSSQLMRRVDRARELVEDAEPWDLVVLDEAHHARRKSLGALRDKGANQLLALMKQLRGRTQGLVLLTATPMQVDPVEVWDLLALLGLPDAWTEQAFLRFFDLAGHPNPSNEDLDWMARLFRASEATYGEMDLRTARRWAPTLGELSRKKVLKALRSGAKTDLKQLDHERRRAATRLMVASTPVAHRVSRHTRELLRSYYRAGKISTRIADRDVRDEFIDLSEPERRVLDAVEDYISTTYDAASAADRNAVGFVMTVYRRRLASSFAALASTLERRLQGLGIADARRAEEDVSDDESRDETMDADEAARLEAEVLALEEKDEIRGLLAAVQALPSVDTKARVLAGQLATLRRDGYERAMVFTQYTDTLDFLRDFLVDEEKLEVLCFSGRGGEVREKSGAWKLVSRDDVKRLFREGSAQVLLCTDAAAEGLNFQFCGALVNYDMPWNPMRVEQRIGRIDRLGQRYEKISIVNLHYADTVETDVYVALRQRIGLFSKFVGKLQPILAALPRRIGEAVLTGREKGERDRLVSDLDAQIRRGEQEGFDLDAITESDLSEPPRPEALYDLDALDELIRRAELLPPGYRAEALGLREYKLSIPGMHEPLRVTTSPEFFEDHPGSAELWSPGSPLFPAPEDSGGRDVFEIGANRLIDLLRDRYGR